MVSRMDGGAVVNQVNVLAEKMAPDREVSVVQVQAIQEKVQQKAGNEPQLPADKAKQMTDSMNTFLESANTQLRFKFHEKLNEYYVTIVDSTTDEVIREIPSKKLLDIHAAMREFVGLLVDRKI
ncbi:flagellar protein FlaG [Sporosarcina psychrophila]|uniref:flagellar protein FlaG n=1 Tax=Sporosarcina psychrophila TaxID=1476 RepID=UPI00078C40CB|nr:flagellar protein FlaG [Sporosarcina psychrophila]AMQ07525.1 flagellar biosynthesis protein FlaG [Sporosarcina psychrophila]